MSDSSSRSGPGSAPWAGSILPVALILAGCGGGSLPTVDDHLVAATTSSFNVCGDRTGSGGARGAQAMVPALADAISAHVDPRSPEDEPIPGLNLKIHFVDVTSGTDDERFSVRIPPVPGLKPLPPETGHDETDIKAAETWTTASDTRTTARQAAITEAETRSEEIRRAAQMPRASAVITCLASFDEQPVTGTVLISDAQNNRAQPENVTVIGPLHVIQFCDGSPEICAGDLAAVETWWREHGGGPVSVESADVANLAAQVSAAFGGGRR